MWMYNTLQKWPEMERKWTRMEQFYHCLTSCNISRLSLLLLRPNNIVLTCRIEYWEDLGLWLNPKKLYFSINKLLWYKRFSQTNTYFLQSLHYLLIMYVTFSKDIYFCIWYEKLPKIQNGGYFSKMATP